MCLALDMQQPRIPTHACVGLLHNTQELRGAGLRCGAYHADMEPAQRERVHSQWSAGRLQVITATIAFGMGGCSVGMGGSVSTLPPSSRAVAVWVGGLQWHS